RVFAAAFEKLGCDAAVPATEIPFQGKDHTGLIATLLPLNCRESAIAAIFVQDPVRMPSSGGEAFAQLYSLTRSELRVLIAMAPGLSVKETAKALGIAETTVKTHLQHIYCKTGTSKSTELLRLFLSYATPVKMA